jgi:hypothetical protein
MSVINDVCARTENYFNALPANTAKQMMRSFIGAGVLYTVLNNNLQIGFAAGAISATASAVHSLLTPLFNHLNEGRDLSWAGEMARTFTAVVVTNFLIESYGFQIRSQTLWLNALIYSFLNRDTQRRDLNSANWIVIFPSL